MSEERNRAEQRFFDERYKHAGETLNGFYSLSRARRHFGDLLYRDCRGLRILEYGCGPSGYAFDLAERGAVVTGIDISATAIDMARQQARSYPDGALTFQQGDAERLEFADAVFDLVCGTSVLHHLDIERAAREVRRVLRPGGRGLFYEPVGHNPVVNLYRKLTPHLHTADEHPLVKSDFNALGAHFREVKTAFYDLFSVGAIPLLRMPGGVAVLRALELVDRAVLKIPGVRWWGSVVIMELRA